MNKSKETLKAYEVREDGEGHCAVVFATNGAAGRREGASELDTEWEAIESCCRKPEFDSYAPGPVPPMVLLEHGWWFECSRCGQRVSQDNEEDDDGNAIAPRPDGKHGIFCSDVCECQDHLAKRDTEEAADALREVFDAKFPGAEVLNLHVYRGPKLLPPEVNGGGKFVVTFAFPGGQQSATWHFGDDRCFVIPADVGAFEAWRKGMPA